MKKKITFDFLTTLKTTNPFYTFAVTPKLTKCFYLPSLDKRVLNCEEKLLYVEFVSLVHVVFAGTNSFIELYHHSRFCYWNENSTLTCKYYETQGCHRRYIDRTIWIFEKKILMPHVERHLCDVIPFLYVWQTELLQI